MLLKSALHKTFRESAKCLFVIVSTLLVVLVSSQINTCAACAQLPNKVFCVVVAKQLKIQVIVHT